MCLLKYKTIYFLLIIKHKAKIYIHKYKQYIKQNKKNHLKNKNKEIKQDYLFNEPHLLSLRYYNNSFKHIIFLLYTEKYER